MKIHKCYDPNLYVISFYFIEVKKNGFTICGYKSPFNNRMLDIYVEIEDD